VAAAKPLLAAAFLGLAGASFVFASAALADKPTVRITKADQARAVAALLHRADFGTGWSGGPIKTRSLTAPDCPGFDPKESDLVVTGHADARYVFQKGDVELDQDVQVLASAQAVKTDFARTISPKLGRCLALQLKKLPHVVSTSVSRLSFPQTGTVSAAYRATISVRDGKTKGQLVSDYVFFGAGRLEYEFTVVAPPGARPQLMKFEVGLAQILLKRAGLLTA
jgi:hypothetical protein